MSLELPANFKNDIQGRDTALYPVIKIGDIYISTNSFGSYKPLLLNIPSLKESIDIEKRNYKISSVNLDISNYEYEGKRFSEIIGDSSLINTKVDIYWVSPRTQQSAIGDFNNDGIIDEVDIGLFYECLFQNSFDPCENPVSPDIIPQGGDGVSTNLDLVKMTNDVADHGGQLPAGYYGWLDIPNAGLHIYSGTVRRYTHDDEKVRLVVEDRSQATLHKDLPLPEHYLGTGDDVPDKYKNKPIPMVYGHVDRSPVVSRNGNRSFIADLETVEFLGSTTGTEGNIINGNIFEEHESPLYLENDSYYINIVEDNQLNIQNNEIALIDIPEGSPTEQEGYSLLCTDGNSNYQLGLSNILHNADSLSTDFASESSLSGIMNDNDNTISFTNQFTENEIWQYQSEMLLLKLQFNFIPSLDHSGLIVKSLIINDRVIREYKIIF